MNDFTASSRTSILKKYCKCMREEYNDSSYNLMPVSWFILKQQHFYPHYFCIINANVSGKGVSHLSITVKILLTSQNPWKDLRDFLGTTDQTLMTHCLKSFPSSLWLWRKQAEAWYQRSTTDIYIYRLQAPLPADPSFFPRGLIAQEYTLLATCSSHITLLSLANKNF